MKITMDNNLKGKKGLSHRFRHRNIQAHRDGFRKGRSGSGTALLEQFEGC